MEEADRIRAAADAGDERIGKAALALHHLRARLLADDRLEVAHHRGIGMGTGGRADQIIGIAHVGDPIAQRFVHRVLERAGAGRDRVHLRAEHVHARDVRRLARDVGRAHVDLARQAEAGANGGDRHAVLAGARLGDDARLAHAAGELDLAEAIVDLVAARVVQLVALEVDLRATLAARLLRDVAEMLRQALGVVERARPAAVVQHEVGQLGLERRIVPGVVVGFLQIEDQRHQRLGDETAAEHAEEAAIIRPRTQRVGLRFRRLLVFGGHRPCVLSIARAVFKSLARMGPSKEARAYFHASLAAFAARRKRRINSGSFSPGRLSTPEETSTMAAPVKRMASATFSGVRPPASA